MQLYSGGSLTEAESSRWLHSHAKKLLMAFERASRIRLSVFLYMVVTMQKGDKPQCAVLIKSLLVSFADVPLAYASHMMKIRVNMGRCYTRAWLSGIV